MTFINFIGLEKGWPSCSSRRTEEGTAAMTPEGISIPYKIIMIKSQCYSELIISAHGETSGYYISLVFLSEFSYLLLDLLSLMSPEYRMI